MFSLYCLWCSSGYVHSIPSDTAILLYTCTISTIHMNATYTQPIELCALYVYMHVVYGANGDSTYTTTWFKAKQASMPTIDAYMWKLGLDIVRRQLSFYMSDKLHSETHSHDLSFSLQPSTFYFLYEFNHIHFIKDTRCSKYLFVY